MMYKLFIADDQFIIIQGLKKLLNWQSLGIEIIGDAVKGDEAEKLILSLKPDIAVLDIQMPGKSGLDILHDIKRHGLATKVIFLSAYEKFEYAQDALKSGASDYLTKPISKEKLREAVTNAIKRINEETAVKTAMVQAGRARRARGESEEDGEFSLTRLLQSVDNEQIRQIIMYMNERFAENISLEKMAKRANMNPYYFSVFFKKSAGLHFKDCLTNIRLEHARDILDREDVKTYDLASMVGYEDPRHFAKVFKKAFGVSPKEYATLSLESEEGRAPP
jgi:YesN/AraC family two-component response regulator